MHHGDTELAGDERIGRMNRGAVQADFALVRHVDAREDFAQSALAGAVLADERVTTAALDLETHSIQRQHAGEAFSKVVKSEKRH